MDVIIMKKYILKNRKGQALVETAIILMLIALFTYGITEFGRAMYIKNMLNNAARAGARQAVVTGSLSLPFTYGPNAFPINDTSSSKNIILTKISDGLMYVNKADIVATVDGNNASATPGDTITVTVTLNNFEPVVNIIKITDKLTGQATMRYE